MMPDNFECFSDLYKGDDGSRENIDNALINFEPSDLPYLWRIYLSIQTTLFAKVLSENQKIWDASNIIQRMTWMAHLGQEQKFLDLLPNLETRSHSVIDPMLKGVIKSNNLNILELILQMYNSSIGSQIIGYICRVGSFEAVRRILQHRQTSVGTKNLCDTHHRPEIFKLLFYHRWKKNINYEKILQDALFYEHSEPIQLILTKLPEIRVYGSVEFIINSNHVNLTRELLQNRSFLCRMFYARHPVAIQMVTEMMLKHHPDGDMMVQTSINQPHSLVAKSLERILSNGSIEYIIV